MKDKHITLLMLICLALCLYSCNSKVRSHINENDIVRDVDISHFSTKESVFEIKIVDCTLSNGVKTKCYEIITKGLIPKEHEVGPWCIDNVNDSTAKGGLWFKDGKLYNVDGQFIKDLPELYHDDYWHLHDEQGNVNKTVSKEDCIELKSARLVDKFTNYCIECLPEYVDDISKTYIIPISPVKLENPINLGGGPPGNRQQSNSKPKGPPPPNGKNKQHPTQRGIAFNGVVFDAPAPLHIILSGYTIPPLDHAGGHINLDSGYHYHAATGATKNIKQSDNHPSMIGYAMDGYGMYTELDEKGQAAQDLDECRGHYDNIRGYHYHVDAAGNNNFINCFSGAIAE